MSYRITQNRNRSGSGDTIIKKIIGYYPDRESAIAQIGSLRPVFKKDKSIWLYEETTPSFQVEADVNGREAVGFIKPLW